MARHDPYADRGKTVRHRKRKPLFTRVGDGIWIEGRDGERPPPEKEAELEERFRSRGPRRGGGGKSGAGVPRKPKDAPPTLQAEADPEDNS